MTLKVVFSDDFYPAGYYKDTVPVQHISEWQGGELAWDEHMTNFLIFLSMCGYIIEHGWIEELQATAKNLCNPPKIQARKRSKK